MKNILKYLVLLFGVAAFATSCTNDPVDYAWPEEESGLKLWFSESATTAYELAENQSSISFYLYRNQTDNALEVPINVECVTEEAYYEDAEGNAACIFELPTTAKFEAGSDAAQVRVLFTFSEIEPEREYEFELAVADEENNSLYGAAELEFSIASYPAWEDAGWGTFDNPTMGLFGWPTFVEYMPIQHKAGTNLYRLPRYNAYWMESNMQALIDDGTFADEAAFNEELEWQHSNSQHIVFQINDSNKSDGGNDWDFYNMAEGVQDDEASFLYGGLISDYFHGHGYMFATENFQSGYKKYCAFINDSSVDRKFYITYIFMYRGSAYNFANWVFDWKENPFYTGDSWEIKTDFNADFEYSGDTEVAFTPAGFPELGTYNVKFQESYDKEGLFYLADAFGVEGYGLAIFVNDNKVTIPADQPTGRVQNGMMVYVGPSGASMIDVDGNLKLSLEYYMIEEKTIMPEGGAEELPVQPDGEQVVPAVDPDDDRFEWPSGVVGKGERYEIVEAEETPDAPAADPEPIVTTRRISLGTFEEIASTSGYAPTALEDFIGEYAVVAYNYGPDYLGDYVEYYPGVAETVALNVKIEAGEKDDEVIITGLFSNNPNGDTNFADFAGKDKVVGVYNRIGGYILLYPQALKDKVTVLGDEATGKPSVDFAVNFAPFDLLEEAEVDAPMMLVMSEGKIYFIPASSEIQYLGYTFMSDYDGGTMMNYDIPYGLQGEAAINGVPIELTVTAAIDEGTVLGRTLWGNNDSWYKGLASVNGLFESVKLSWECNFEYDKVVIAYGDQTVEVTEAVTSKVVENVKVSPTTFTVSFFSGEKFLVAETVSSEVYTLPEADTSAQWVAEYTDNGFIILGTGWNTKQYTTAHVTFNIYEKGSETPVFDKDVNYKGNLGTILAWTMGEVSPNGVCYAGGGNRACHGGDGNNWDEGNLPTGASVVDGKEVFTGLDSEKEYVVKYTLKVWPYIFDAENPNNKELYENASGQPMFNYFFKKMLVSGTTDTYYNAIDLTGEAALTFKGVPAEPETTDGE